MPFPADLTPWKVNCTWTSPSADGSVTVTNTFRCMAISSADCLAKARAGYIDFQAVAPVTYGTPSQGW